jgi:selenium metabolism protein YedF
LDSSKLNLVGFFMFFNFSLLLLQIKITIMRIIDTQGQLCPAPLIATKRALKETKISESFQVITDSITSLNNLSRFLTDNNTDFQVVENSGVWILTITKTTPELIKPKAETYCLSDIPHFTNGNFVISFSSDKMGEGDNKLGDLLMINFVKAIKDLDELPHKMVFYNKGVLLGSENSPVLEHLKEIEKMGVKLFLCATCVNHYSLEGKITIGTLSNMFEIVQIMASSGNVIKP